MDFMRLIAKTHCSDELEVHLIKNPWPYKCKKVVWSEWEGDDIEVTDRTNTRKEYAKFICALLWKQIDLSKRNEIFNCLRYVFDSWIFGSRMLYRAKKAYEENKHIFTKKQVHNLEKLLPEDVSDNGSDIIDTDDEDEANAPGICPSCQENPPGDKILNYECDSCANQTAGAISMYYDYYWSD